ncbi:hypothetical protein ABDD95_18675 [Mucilaginibacter sp. PAMB04274]|uniref:hypothetical protein n=1 Tax=Mucilaginibacter sp. PAMB04274 TaxID=3138568 RepID=UPI0031F6651B
MDRAHLSEQEFADYYNIGYGLNKMSPEIAELIVSTQTRTPQLDALKAGIEISREPEKEKSHLPDWLKKDWFKEDSRDMTQDKTKEKGQERDEY